MQMNMEAGDVSDHALAFPESPAVNSSPFPSHLITSDCDQSQLGALVNGPIFSDSFQTLDAPLPMHLHQHHAAEIPRTPQFPPSLSYLNRINQAPLHPLEYMTSLRTQQASSGVTPYSSLTNASYALSLTLPGGVDKSFMNQTDRRSGENGKPGIRRRARRQRPLRTFGERSSQFRGVSSSRYRYTGRYEAFLWDNTDPKGKAKTVYVGVFDEEEEAARAYDLAALKFWGKTTPTNFPVGDYENDLEEMENMSKKEYLLSIRRKSKCFSKGASIYRGVSRNTDYTKWQARVGRGHGLRGIYLGTFDTEEEAARAYDIALIRFKGLAAVTNFDLSHYDVRSILISNTLPIGKGASRLLKRTSVKDVISRRKRGMEAPSMGDFPDTGNPSNFRAPNTAVEAKDINNAHNSYRETWKVEAGPSDPQNHNSQFYDQICNIDTKSGQKQQLSQYGHQSQKLEMSSPLVHELSRFDRAGTMEMANDNSSDKGFSSEKKLPEKADEGHPNAGIWKGFGEVQSLGQFQDLAELHDAKVQGYQLQNPDFHINPNLFLGLSNVGYGGIQASNSNENSLMGGRFSDNAPAANYQNSSKVGDLWGYNLQMTPIEQYLNQTSNQNYQLPQIPRDLPNQFLDQSQQGSLANSNFFHSGGGFPVQSSGSLEGNSAMVMNSPVISYAAISRNEYPAIGVGAGESSARENAESGEMSIESLTEEEANMMSSPSSWMESFFRDADPPSFIL